MLENEKSLSPRALEVITGEFDSRHVSVTAVEGGYSRNRRAIVSLDHEEVFLKEVDTSVLPDDGEVERAWLKKDHELMEQLRKQVPELVPEWSRLTMEDRLLVMPSYSREKGWLWVPPTDHDQRARYIDAVVGATKKFEQVHFSEALIDSLSLQPFFRDALAHDDSIDRVIEEADLRQQLTEKYTSLLIGASPHLQVAYKDVLTALEDSVLLAELARRTKILGEQPQLFFNHCDVRSDNIAYQPETGEIKFVDWNWASYAPTNFGSTEFLVDIATRGIDIEPWYNSLNPEQLAAQVGLYIIKSLKAPLFEGSTLRQMQAAAGALSLHLFLTIT